MTYRASLFVVAMSLASFLAQGAYAAASRMRPQKGMKRAPDIILVKFKGAASESQRAAALSRHQLTDRGGIERLGVRAVAIPPGQTPEDVIRRLKADSGSDLEYAEPNQYHYARYAPNDPQIATQYHLSAMSCPTAWDVTQGSGFTLAIADTGIDASHPDLAAHITPGVNSWENDTVTADEAGHGTIVAGTAAEIGDNGTNGAGCAYNATILPIKITPTGDTFGISDDLAISSAIVYAADHGIKVVNLSFGPSMSCDSSTMRSAGDYLKARGGWVVQASGNDGLDLGCPTNNSIIEVSAVDSSNVLASFSNYGQNVSITAPGVEIITTNCDTCSDFFGNGAMTPPALTQGTSFASPNAAAVLALIYTVFPEANAAQSRQILFDSADDLGAAGYDTLYGWGIPNAGRAVQLAQERRAYFLQQAQLSLLSNVYAYPNPWDTRRHSQRQVTFANLPDVATVKIFTLSGFLVKTINASNTRAVWDLTNDNGESVASGLYLFLAESGGNSVKGKIVIIK